MIDIRTMPSDELKKLYQEICELPEGDRHPELHDAIVVELNNRGDNP